MWRALARPQLFCGKCRKLACRGERRPIQKGPRSFVHNRGGGRKALSEEKAKYSMTASDDLLALIEARRRYGVESWTYRMLLAGLVDTAKTVGIERFLDDIAGASK